MDKKIELNNMSIVVGPIAVEGASLPNMNGCNPERGAKCKFELNLMFYFILFFIGIYFESKLKPDINYRYARHIMN